MNYPFAEMKTLLSIIIVTAALGWSPASEIIQHGQGNVAAANASALNRAAQMASIEGKSFDSNSQDAQAVIEQLHGLGYLSQLDAQKMKGTVGRLRPTGAFGTWSDVEFAVR